MRTSGNYILAPGARLVVGPGGELEESLGACCASCSKGGVGDATIKQGGIFYAGATPGAPSSGSAIPLLLGLGAVGVAGFFVVRRLRRRRR